MGGGESCTGEGRIIRLERLEKKKREREKVEEIEMVYPRGLYPRDNGFLVIKR